MPWYYAGPEAKPVGPLSLEELHARQADGIVTPETYVIEHTGRPMENWAWKRYREVFPANLPPAPPPVIPAPPPAVALQVLSPQANPPHPLFPSAAPAPGQHPVFPATARPDPYYKVKPTNGWCAWGFGLGLAGFFFSFACGTGAFLALPALFLCIVGLVQVHRNREQAGQGLAIAGLILSGIALLISLLFIASYAMKFKWHDFTVTEQTSNDSE